MKVGLGLGANIGDRLQSLQQARTYLLSLSTDGWGHQSPLYQTVPVDCPPGSGPFLNAVVEIEFRGTARTLLKKLLAYEKAHGRDRSGGVNAPRTVDIDILYFGDQEMREQDLVIPHPRLAQRRFVLLPLSTIRPELIIPGTGKDVPTLLQELPAGAEEVTLLQEDW